MGIAWARSGKTKGGWVYQIKTWWYNYAVNDVVKEKQHKWKQWKLGGSKEGYQLMKKAACHTVYDAKQQADNSDDDDDDDDDDDELFL